MHSFRRSATRLFALTAILYAAHIASAQSPGEIFGLERPLPGAQASLVAIDPTTLLSSFVAFPSESLQDITFDPVTETVYALTDSYRLATLDLDIGLVTIIGPPAGSLVPPLDWIAVDNAGLVHAIDESGGYYDIDAATGNATYVGDTGVGQVVGFDFDPATGGGYTISFDIAGTAALYSIDPGTGAGTFVAQTDQIVTGMDFGGNGDLWIANAGNPPMAAPSEMLSVDLMTGQTQWLGVTDVQFLFSFVVIPGGAPIGDPFARGDVNSDSSFDISDPIFLLSNLFTFGPDPQCADAADINDDGGIDIADAVFALASLFVPGSPAIPTPGFPSCGADPTVDTLDCEGSGCL